MAENKAKGERPIDPKEWAESANRNPDDFDEDTDEQKGERKKGGRGERGGDKKKGRAD